MATSIRLEGSCGCLDSITSSYPSIASLILGSFSATTKNFDIPDPRYGDDSQRLIHSSLEGPEVGVYYRGEATLKNGRAVVNLPDYFEDLTGKEGRTVLLTPKFGTDGEPVSNLAASAVADGKFSVGAINGESCPALLLGSKSGEI
jgi:hypothetical protein